MTPSRRHFLRSAAALAMAAPAYGALASCAGTPGADGDKGLVVDREGWLDLPPGFTYRRLSAAGSEMSDGLIVPKRHDGMGCFAGPDAARATLVRNPEMKPGAAFMGSAFGEDGARLAGFDTARVWDTDSDGVPVPGGTTTLLYNTRTGALERAHLSLAGTATNCSGGVTPWGSWLTCEETVEGPGRKASRAHGYVFEVPATATGPVTPVALTAMGRFEHEAAAIDPDTGIVYMTEDDEDGLFYRFLPDAPGELAKGGRLQALKVKDQAGLDTRNWGTGPDIAPGQGFAAEWIDLDHVEAPDADLRLRGFAKGAAKFARGEGCAWATDTAYSGAVYFACTTGGGAKKGQIWAYQPASGQLTLHYESPGADTMDMCDNIVASPWGHLIICEDGDYDQFVHGLRPDGTLYTIARNAHPGRSELAGACFSPDGATLFVNVQTPGATYAITGPWAQLAMG